MLQEKLENNLILSNFSVFFGKKERKYIKFNSLNQDFIFKLSTQSNEIVELRP